MPRRTEANVEQRSAIALGALLFGAAAPFVYVASRAYDHLRGAVEEPQLLFMTVYTGFYWRVAIAIWAGLVCAAIGGTWLRRQLARGSETKRLSDRVTLIMTLLTVLSATGAALFP